MVIEISSLMPFRNAAPTLERALNSLSFCKEIIGIDDHSSDSGDVIFSYYGDVLRFEQRLPIWEMRRRLIEEAQSEFCIFCDADDYRISSDFAYLYKNTDFDMLVMPYAKPNGAIPSLTGDIFTDIMRNLLHHSAVVLRTSLIKGLPMYEGLSSEYWLIARAVIERQPRIVYYKSKPAFQWTSGNNQLSTRVDEIVESRKQLARYIHAHVSSRSVKAVARSIYA